MRSALTGPETVACELRATRYDIIMQGFGGGGETVDTLDQVGPAVKRAFASGIPYCINVNIRSCLHTLHRLADQQQEEKFDIMFSRCDFSFCCFRAPCSRRQ